MANEQEVGHLLEGGIGRQLLDRVSGQDQASGLAVHLAHARRRGNDSIQTIHVPIVRQHGISCQY
jgi:hypothetical protein